MGVCAVGVYGVDVCSSLGQEASDSAFHFPLAWLQFYFFQVLKSELKFLKFSLDKTMYLLYQKKH